MENKECFHLFNKKYYGGLSLLRKHILFQSISIKLLIFNISCDLKRNAVIPPRSEQTLLPNIFSLSILSVYTPCQVFLDALPPVSIRGCGQAAESVLSESCSQAIHTRGHLMPVTWPRSRSQGEKGTPNDQVQGGKSRRRATNFANVNYQRRAASLTSDPSNGFQIF